MTKENLSPCVFSKKKKKHPSVRETGMPQDVKKHKGGSLFPVLGGDYSPRYDLKKHLTSSPAKQCREKKRKSRGKRSTRGKHARGKQKSKRKSKKKRSLFKQKSRKGSKLSKAVRARRSDILARLKKRRIS
jgi:hypothetical protein